jgi:anti-sigma regulatory factor (Ser/Thr protein kinase)
MDKQEAIRLLESDSAHNRLRGANFFVENLTQADLHELSLFRGRETVSYVKRRLEIAMERLLKRGTSADGDQPSEPEIPEAVRKQLWVKATEVITGMLLHEFESRVGLARAAAAAEIETFEGSKTRLRFDGLESVLEGFRQLRKASAAPKPSEFDLSQLIRDTIVEASANKGIEVSLQGSQPFLISSDASLLRLALSNGIRNAMESVVSLQREKESHAIVVTWGKTDIEYWVAIIDRGAGIDGPIEAAFEIGRTTKTGHGGFGLAIVRQAMETIGGTAVLQPGASGGARLELKWGR